LRRFSRRLLASNILRREVSRLYSKFLFFLGAKLWAFFFGKPLRIAKV
jgi:hypothetical protein